jgi:ribulose 1,5-bisphosphate carboxylase large subunit-like protein
LSAGGAIHGHPIGAAAGAKAMRLAIDAVINGVRLEEYTKNNEELKAALDKWI